MSTERRVVKVIVLRHGKQVDMGRGYTCWSPDAVLAPEGIKMMSFVSGKHERLFRTCEVFACSPFIRAQQSLFTMMEALGFPPQKMDDVLLMNGLKTADPSVWVSENPTELVSSFWRREEDRVTAEGEHGYLGVCEIAALGKNALCISHGGVLDTAVAWAKSLLGEDDAFANIKDIGKGEGFVFGFEDDKLSYIDRLS